MFARQRNQAMFATYFAEISSNADGQYSVRRRFTIAEVNAGATLLPAIPGFKYRINDAIMIAVGGAVTSATSVNILGTLAAVSRILLAVAVAALTQSAVVRMGAANAVVLADGASFTAGDVNTAITVITVGSAITVATHVDVIVEFSLDEA